MGEERDEDLEDEDLEDEDEPEWITEGMVRAELVRQGVVDDPDDETADALIFFFETCGIFDSEYEPSDVDEAVLEGLELAENAIEAAELWLQKRRGNGGE